jgi:hypothetical protein
LPSGALALVVLLLLLRAFADASVTQAKRGLAWFAGALGLVLAGVLILSGRGGQAIWTAVLFGPVLWRWFQGWRAARTFARGGAASPGQESDVATATLEMGLDHDSGRMWGREGRALRPGPTWPTSTSPLRWNCRRARRPGTATACRCWRPGWTARIPTGARRGRGRAPPGARALRPMTLRRHWRARPLLRARRKPRSAPRIVA